MIIKLTDSSQKNTSDRLPAYGSAGRGSRAGGQTTDNDRRQTDGRTIPTGGKVGKTPTIIYG